MAKEIYTRKEYATTQIAYLAGIIDGEGSIYIGNFSSNPVTGNPYYQTNVQVTNTDKPLIDWLSQTFGGLISKRTPRQMAHNSTKQAWVWTASGDRVTHLCEIILPFVICKKRQCEIMLKMRATYTKLQHKKGSQGVQAHSKELLDLRQSYMDEMRSLHCRTYSYKNG